MTSAITTTTLNSYSILHQSLFAATEFMERSVEQFPPKKLNPKRSYHISLESASDLSEIKHLCNSLQHEIQKQYVTNKERKTLKMNSSVSTTADLTCHFLPEIKNKNKFKKITAYMGLKCLARSHKS